MPDVTTPLRLFLFAKTKLPTFSFASKDTLHFDFHELFAQITALKTGSTYRRRAVDASWSGCGTGEVSDAKQQRRRRIADVLPLNHGTSEHNSSYRHESSRHARDSGLIGARDG